MSTNNHDNGLLFEYQICNVNIEDKDDAIFSFFIFFSKKNFKIEELVIKLRNWPKRLRHNKITEK